MLLALQMQSVAPHDVPGLTNAHSWLCTPCPVTRTWIDSSLKNDLTALFLSCKLLLVALWHWLRDLPNPEMHSLSEHLSSLIYRFRVFFFDYTMNQLGKRIVEMSSTSSPVQLQHQCEVFSTIIHYSVTKIDYFPFSGAEG